jgi:hypothetical protein
MNSIKKKYINLPFIINGIVLIPLENIVSFHNLLKNKNMQMQNNEFRVEFPTKLNKSNFNLDPYFITGLIEAEGSFSIMKFKNKRAKYDINIGLRFKISMLANETPLLNMVKSFFGCGNIFIRKDGNVSFEVKDMYSINKYIVPHFCNYPLRGTKHLDFLTFKKSVDIINSKKHLTKKGIDQIIEMSNSMNSYREFLADYCPIHAIEGNSEYIPINGHYINGFIAGDACLALNTKDVGFGRMSLQISQHKNNRFLLLSLANYFKSPNKIYYHNINSIQVILSGIKL